MYSAASTRSKEGVYSVILGPSSGAYVYSRLFSSSIKNLAAGPMYISRLSI